MRDELSSPRSGQLRGRKGKEIKAAHSKQISVEHLLCAGASLVVKGLTLASVNPALAEKMAFFLEGVWEGVVPKRAHICETWGGGSFSPLIKALRASGNSERTCAL